MAGAGLRCWRISRSWRPMPISANRCMAGPDRCRSSGIAARTGLVLRAHGGLRSSPRWAIEMQEDQNSPWADGVFPTTFNVDQGLRGSAALVYLSAEVRRRRNLTILTRHAARPARINRARGSRARLRVVRRNNHHRSGAAGSSCRRVALQSPVVLMRSGIGPGRISPTMGSRCRRPAVGVGRICRSIPTSACPATASISAAAAARGASFAGAATLFLGLKARRQKHACCDRVTRRMACGGGRRIGALGFCSRQSSCRPACYKALGLAGQTFSAWNSPTCCRTPRDMARLRASFRMGVRAMLAAGEVGVVLDIFPNAFSAPHP